MKIKSLLTILAALPAMSFAATVDVSGWSVSGVTLLPVETLAGLSAPDGATLAARIVDAYRARGFVTIEAKVNPADKTILIVEGAAKPSGPYAAFVPAGKPLTAGQLDAAATRIAAAARLNGERVGIAVRPADASGAVEVATSSTKDPDARQYGGSVVYSSLGQRYSGADVGTVYGYVNPGHGQQFDASVSHGFSSLRDDSENGRFENANLGYRIASPFGLTSLQYQFVDYKTGGQIAPLDLHGSVDRVQLQQLYPVDRFTSLVGRLAYTRNKQTLGVLSWNDQQSYTSAFAGFSHQRQFLSFDVGIEQGISGYQHYNVTPLMGRMDSHYSAFIFNMAGLIPLGSSGWTISAKGGFQSGDDGTPSNSQFYLGGPDRGQSYNTGYAAVPEGYFASLSVNTKAWQGVQGYAGVDGSKGHPVTGADRKASSAFIGARFQIAKRYSGDVAFARTIGSNDDLTAKKTKINAVLSATF